MQAIQEQDWQALPEQAQQEVYDFFLFIRQRYGQLGVNAKEESDTITFANHSANTIKEWLSEKEDEVWR